MLVESALSFRPQAVKLTPQEQAERDAASLYREYGANWAVLGDTNQFNLDSWAQSMAQALRVMKATNEELMQLAEPGRIESQHLELVLGYYSASQERPFITKIQKRINQISEQTKGFWDRLQKPALSWFKREDKGEKTNKSYAPNFSAGAQQKRLNPALRVGLAAGLLGTASLPFWGGQATTEMLGNSIDHNSVEQNNDAPAVDEISVALPNFSGKDSLIPQDSLIDFPVAQYKRYSTLEVKVQEGDSLLDAVERSWMQHFGVKPSTDQTIATTVRILHANKIEDPNLNTNPYNNGSSRFIQIGTRFSVSVQGVLVA